MDDKILEEIRQVSKEYPDGIHRRSSAKEMFEELGYICLGGSDYIAIKYYKREKQGESHSTYDIDITFYSNSKTVAAIANEYSKKNYKLEVMDIDMKLLQAINKQVEELGWLNE